MTKVLYISSYQFSGTTLAAFLLNSHSRIATVGHTMGWAFGDDEEFFCSCGVAITDCPFYRDIAKAYSQHGLEFDIRNFGTAYSLSSNDRLNRMLTASIPGLRSTRLELLRDIVVRHIPGLSNRMNRSDHANRIFVNSVLDLTNADVFLDNSHDPYRFRHLCKIPEFNMHHMHLIRDPRGVALSCRRHLGWSAQLAMKLWLRRQADIFRIARESPHRILVYYEDLCIHTEESLKRVHDFLGLAAEAYTGDFRAGEHHILGNDMRLQAREIKLDMRWQHELTSSELKELNSLAENYVSDYGQDDVGRVLAHYFPLS